MANLTVGERPDFFIDEIGIRLSGVDPSTLARYVFASPLVQDKKVLEVGCGLGLGAFVLSFWAKEVLGVDVSADAVEEANKLKKRYQIPNINFKTISADKLNLKEKFDVITAFEIIEHIDKVSGTKAIAAFSKVLKDGGVLLISTPNIDLRGKSYWKYHQHEYFSIELKNILTKHFKHVKSYYQCGNGLVIADNFLRSLIMNPYRPDATLIFVCSNQPIKSRYNEEKSMPYLIARGLYRNTKYLLTGS